MRTLPPLPAAPYPMAESLAGDAIAIARILLEALAQGDDETVEILVLEPEDRSGAWSAAAATLQTLGIRPGTARAFAAAMPRSIALAEMYQDCFRFRFDLEPGAFTIQVAVIGGRWRASPLPGTVHSSVRKRLVGRLRRREEAVRVPLGHR